MCPGSIPGVTLIRKSTVALATAALALITTAALVPAPASTTTAAFAVQPAIVTIAHDMPAVLPAAAAAPTSYRVVLGDTLSQISQRFCGSAGHYRNLAAASGIGNYDLIYPGQMVTLNCSATPAPVKAAAPAPHQAARAVAAVDTAATTGRGGAVAAFALSQVGKRYVWAAAGPNAYDCSGLVVAAFARLGVKLPHQTGSLLGYGKAVSRGQLQPGDVIWPQSGHVMIYVGNGRVVEAADPQQGVRTNSVYAFMTARRYV